MTHGTITLYIASSVDGYIAAADGGVSWLEPFEQSASGEEIERYDAFFESVDCLVMGSRTYEQVLGFGDWPYGETPTVVVTSRDLPSATDAVERFDGTVASLVDRLTTQYDHVWLVGGAALAQSFLDQTLVDQLRLSLIPVLRNGGIRLFDGEGEPAALTLVETTTTDTGIVELTYDIGA